MTVLSAFTTTRGSTTHVNVELRLQIYGIKDTEYIPHYLRTNRQTKGLASLAMFIQQRCILYQVLHN